MKPTQVLLLFGGESSEHDVSIMSARNVYGAIDQGQFDTHLVYIGRDGRWWLCEKLADHEGPSALEQVQLTPGSGELRAGRRTLAPDVVLPVLHGQNGEDGSMQGLAQLLHLPIVGCDMTSSAASMDKVIAKRIAAQVGITVVPYMVYRRGDAPLDYETVGGVLGETMFVKPSRAGSSVGVSKVRDAQQFAGALTAALAVDTTVLIEQALEVRELEVAVLGNPPAHQVSRVGEVIPGADFYSYADKYDMASTSTTRIPSEISDEAASSVQRQASLLYAELGCTGLARIDFFLTASGDVFFNEINTLPGFTDISMYPKLWQDSGIGYSELIARLIRRTLG